MKTDAVWTPHGAARRLLEEGRRSSGGSHGLLPEYPEDLRRHVVEGEDAHDDGDALFHIAWEVARCGAPLSPGEHRAVLVLVLAALRASREGSTRIPIGDPKSLQSRLAEIGASAADWRTVESILPAIRAIADPSSAPTRPSSSEGMGAIFGGPGDRRPLVVDGDWLSLQRLHVAEERFVRVVLDRFDPSQPLSERACPFIDASKIDAALAAVEERPPFFGDNPLALSDEQKHAIRTAAGNRLALVTGGPGTGKTSIVVSLLRVLLRLGVEPADIALAAPTGKAANRMEESARSYLGAIRDPSPEDLRLMEGGTSPRTLHRLLGHSPFLDSFRHHSRHPIPEKVVIVDESSMIDLLLMERLLSAVAPDALLVLLGDAEQLPSVDAGAVFRDLVDETTWPGDSPAVRLTHSYRMREDDPDGRRVLAAARAINTGRVDDLLDSSDGPLSRRGKPADLEFRGVELLDTPVDSDPASPPLLEFLERWWNERLLLSGEARSAATRVFRREATGFDPHDERVIRALLAHYEAQRVLCLTRVAPITGSQAVNSWFHSRRTTSDPLLASGGRSQVDLTPAIGEPVMMLRNDYVRGLFNGDQGVVVRVSDDGGSPRPMVVFPRAGGLEAHSLDLLVEDLTLCYAMTVHKSQGSEYGAVALILPSTDVPLLTREVLYTAVTRARKSVVIVGSGELLAAGVRKPIERFSGVAERLRKSVESVGRGSE